jgi:hypothetical protein
MGMSSAGSPLRKVVMYILFLRFYLLVRAPRSSSLRERSGDPTGNRTRI